MCLRLVHKVLLEVIVVRQARQWEAEETSYLRCLNIKRRLVILFFSACPTHHIPLLVPLRRLPESDPASNFLSRDASRILFAYFPFSFRLMAALFTGRGDRHMHASTSGQRFFAL